MGVYINTNSTQDEKGILDKLKGKHIKCYDCMQKPLGEIESECFACFLDLSMFNDSKVNLKSGGIVGLSYWFEMLIFTVVDPKNTRLRDKLENINAYVFRNEEHAIDVLTGIYDKIMMAETEIKREKSVEMRNKLRGALNNIIGMDIEKSLYSHAKKELRETFT